MVYFCLIFKSVYSKEENSFSRTTEQQQRFHEICSNLVKTRRRAVGWWKRLFTLKEEKPKMVLLRLCQILHHSVKPFFFTLVVVVCLSFCVGLTPLINIYLSIILRVKITFCIFHCRVNFFWFLLTEINIKDTYLSFSST